jgi:hypothetical protein
MSWKVGSRDVEFERDLSSMDYYNDEALWAEALAQIERRLSFALQDFGRYNRLVEKRLPLACRTGKLRRRLSWPKDFRGPLPMRRIQRLETALAEAAGRSLLESMTQGRFLEAAAAAYDAVFKDLRPLSPPAKYKRKADGRHGGLLDLPADDSRAFAAWYHSKSWAGTHPWEIVFGQPHGIMLSPRHDPDADRWGFALWVDSPGWYADAGRMALALAGKKVPFELLHRKEVLDALKGIDDVEVGPDLYSLHFDELKSARPDSLDAVRWDPVPRLEPIGAGQAARIPHRL